jgi:hypothetical protein
MFVIDALMGFIAIPFIFYAVIVSCLILVGLLVEQTDEGDGWGPLTLIASILGFTIATHFGITIAMIKESPSLILMIGGAYLFVGIVWSFFKWYFKISNIRDKYKELKAQYISNRKLPESFLVAPENIENCSGKKEMQDRTETMERNSNFNHYIRTSALKCYMPVSGDEAAVDPRLTVQMIKPLATEHKSSITQWIAFWPVSLIWTMINDPVAKIINWIFECYKGTFQMISDKMFGKL